MLDRARALPLWAQLEAELRSRLARGEFDVSFPTEQQLVAEYDVSRPTVRQALAALLEDGLLVRRRGRGTSVVAPRVEQSLPGAYSLARAISATGRTERSQVLVAERAAPPAAVAARLALRPGADAVHVERVRFADDEPLAVDRSWLPVELGAPLLEADLTHGSLYDVLAAAGVRPTSGTEEIEPCVPTRQDRRRLRLRDGALGYRIHRLLRTGPAPMEDRVSVIRADRYRLTSTWGET
ncbi:MAG: GntR family transcriptional regulator [Acidimicrobiia bacterium]